MKSTKGRMEGSPLLKWKSFWQLMKQHLPRSWQLKLAILLAVLETVFSLLIPLLTRNVVDQVSISQLQMTTVILLAGLFVLQSILSGYAMYTMSSIGQHVVASLRSEIWCRVIRLPVSFYDQSSSGETMSRVTNDTHVIKDFITMHVVPFLSGLIAIVGALTLLLVMDWKMTVLMLIAVPIAILILAPLGVRMFAISRDMQNETAKFQGDLGRVLADIRLVKASGAEAVEEQQGKNRIRQLFQYGLREAKINSIVSPLMMTVMLLVLLLLFGYGGVRVSAGTLSAGSLVAIILYMFQIVVPMTQLASFFTQFQKAVGASERVQEILDEGLEAGQDQATVILMEKEDAGAHARGQDIIFEAVGFGYSQERTIIEHVSFTAEAGQMTALVGPSGAGKTTLFALIERFYDPTAGVIRYGQMSVHSFSVSAWRSKIAYVSQESPVMEGSIKYNLTYGLDEVSEEAIEESIVKANLKEVIDALPAGLATEVGERGVKLSGGQRQRIAIARAILRNPEILLLDEATAHLDSASEHAVQQALQLLMVGRTTLVIAHRLSTIRGADKLIVLEQGKVTGQGTHQQLMESHALYRELVMQQSQPQQEAL